jgi:hypothetical protein
MYLHKTTREARFYGRKFKGGGDQFARMYHVLPPPEV